MPWATAMSRRAKKLGGNRTTRCCAVQRRHWAGGEGKDVQDKFVATLKGGLTLMPRDDTAGAHERCSQGVLQANRRALGRRGMEDVERDVAARASGIPRDPQ